jgi:lysine 2,3-aminomutase
MYIKPEIFDELHDRGGGTHRLRANVDKWRPLGIGTGTEEEPRKTTRNSNRPS